MNAFGYWIYLAGGLFLYVASLLNIGPDAGWFAYPPLAGPQFSPGKRRRRLGADDHLHRDLGDCWSQSNPDRHHSSSMRAPGHVA